MIFGPVSHLGWTELVKTNESTIRLGDFNAHVGYDSRAWWGVIGWHGDVDVNDNGRVLLQPCCNNALWIMNTLFQHGDVRKYTWCRGSLGQRSLIDCYMVSGDLLRSVLDVRVKSGAELSTNHHLLVCHLNMEKLQKLKQTCRTRRSYRIKWEALADKGVRRPLRTAYCPYSENSGNAQWTRRWSGGCLKQL